MNEAPNETKKNLSALLEEMRPVQLGTLAFNLSAIAWIGLNVSFRGFSPHYLPGSYIQPNMLNIVCGGILLYSCYLAFLATKRGSLIPAVITFTFAWSLVASIVRQYSE